MSLVLTDTELLELRKFTLQMAKQNSPMDRDCRDIVAAAKEFESYIVADNETAPAQAPVP